MNRRFLPLLLVALALGAVPSVAVADAQGATIDKTGWWSRANTTTPTPAGPVTVPPPPGIPDDGLVVGYLSGDDPTAITAIGIQPDVGPGATARSLVLRVREDPDAPGNQGTDGAVIIACPITDFWAGGPNGAWDTRPTVDCAAASAPGTRDDDGTWEFDLTPIATLWFDTFGDIRADGVVLRPDVEESGPFQAVFAGGDDIDVVLDADPAADEGTDPFAAPSAPIPTDSGLSNSGGGSGIIGSPQLSSPPTAPLETPPVPEADVTGGDADESAAPPLADAPATEPVASRAGELFGNFSPLVLLGILLFGGVLLVLSYWLGPNGQPVATVRQRGVSRALDARARATRGTTS